MIITLLIIVVVAVVAFYIVNEMGLPAPIGMVVRIIVGLILLVAVLKIAGIALP